MRASSPHDLMCDMDGRRDAGSSSFLLKVSLVWCVMEIDPSETVRPDALSPRWQSGAPESSVSRVADVRCMLPLFGRSWFKRLAHAGTTAVGLALSQGTACAMQAEAGPTTHLLAIGICPPWKPTPQKVCEDGVAAMTAALEARLGIADENILTLLNASATTEGLRQGLAHFQDLGPNDRLIIFANLHSGPLAPGVLATSDNDVFVLWTEEKPEATRFALARGDWITARDFAGMVHDSPAGEILMILDSCESDSVSSLFLAEHPDNDEARPEAVIASSKSDQFANFNADGTMALFTQEFSHSLVSTTGSFWDAAVNAASSTAAAAIPICGSNSGQLIDAGFDPLRCRQQPIIHDPNGLLANTALLN